jgi:chitobiase/beta-hexosaminidase-like protein
MTPTATPAGTSTPTATPTATSTAVSTATPTATPPAQVTQAANPGFAPPYDGGTFFNNHALTVTVSSATVGASIRYTLNGSIPTASNGTLMGSSGTVSVTPTIAGKTLQAIEGGQEGQVK